MTEPEIRQLRRNIDACIQEAKGLLDAANRDPGAREVALAHTKLQEAKMWAGMVLGEIGVPLPPQYRDEGK